MRVVSIKPIGTAIFKGPGEFQAGIGGLQSYASSMIIPNPSTIAGLLSTLKMTKISTAPRVVLAPDSWVKEFEDLLGSDFIIRGPYIVKNGSIYVPYGRSLLLNANEVIAKLSNKDIIKKIFGEELRYRKWRWIEEIRDKVEALSIEKVGIKLDNRTRIAEENYFYTLRLLDWINMNLEIRADIISGDADFIDQKPVVSDLGGEKRAALVQISEGISLTNIVKKVINHAKESKEWVLYLVSSGLFKTLKIDFETSLRRILIHKEESKASAYFSYPNPLHLIYEQLPKIYKEEIIILGISGIIYLASAGWSVSKNRRKPAYITVEPGTLVRIRIKDAKPNDLILKIWQYGFSGIANNIGYGTIIPIPLI